MSIGGIVVLVSIFIWLILASISSTRELLRQRRYNAVFHLVFVWVCAAALAAAIIAAIVGLSLKLRGG